MRGSFFRRSRAFLPSSLFWGTITVGDTYVGSVPAVTTPGYSLACVREGNRRIALDQSNALTLQGNGVAARPASWVIVGSYFLLGHDFAEEKSVGRNSN